MPDPWKTMFWALAATALFSVVSALAKFASFEFHVLQILFLRQIIVFLSSLPSLARSFPDSLKTNRPGLHLIRLIAAFVALSCGIWGVAVLPLTTATALAFAQVFFVAIFAAWLLREPVGWHRICTIIAGFIGVLIILRPGIEGLANPFILVPVVGALGAAVAVISVRRLSQSETTASLLLYQSLFVGVLAGVPMLWLWVTPDLFGWGLLISMGLLATAGQWAGIQALRLGDASVVGNFEYSKLIYAAVFGFLLFSEVPDWPTVLGAGIIIGSALYLYHREARIFHQSGHLQR